MGHKRAAARKVIHKTARAQPPLKVFYFPRMESPVRSVETGGNGASGGSAAAGGGGGKDQQHQPAVSAAERGAAGGGGVDSSSSQQRFEAKSYLERQVEELSCADEDEAQEKVSKRLQFKQEQAQKKRYVLFFPSRMKRNKIRSTSYKNLESAGKARAG